MSLAAWPNLFLFLGLRKQQVWYPPHTCLAHYAETMISSETIVDVTARVVSCLGSWVERVEEFQKWQAAPLTQVQT